MYTRTENTELVNVAYHCRRYLCSLYNVTNDSNIIIAQLRIGWIFGSGLWSQYNELYVL